MWSVSLDGGAKNMQWEKDSLFNKWFWENWAVIRKRVKHHYLSPHINNNLKLIKDLKTPETIKLKENIGSKLLDIGLGGGFWIWQQKQK